MKFYKKLGAACLAAVMTLSFAGCSFSNTKWIARCGDLEIPVGVYLTGMLQDYYNVMLMVGGNDKSVLNETGESGKTISEMIQETAKENVTSTIALMSKAEEMGITLTEEEKKEIKDAVDATWNQQGSLYERNGIAKKSVEMLSQAAALSEKIFLALYGEGGEKAVPTEEVKTKYQEQYAKAGLFTFGKPEKSQVAENATEEEKQMAKEIENTALTAAKSSADEWMLRAKDITTEEAFQNLVNEYKAAQGQTVEEGQKIFGLVDLNNEQVPPEIITFLKDGPMNQPTLVETDTYFAIVYKADPMADPADFEAMSTRILEELKSEEFQEYIAQYAQSLEIEYNQKAIDKYLPEGITLG